MAGVYRHGTDQKSTRVLLGDIRTAVKDPADIKNQLDC